jgi:hypothetical protein
MTVNTYCQSVFERDDEHVACERPHGHLGDHEALIQWVNEEAPVEINGRHYARHHAYSPIHDDWDKATVVIAILAVVGIALWRWSKAMR